MFKGQVECIIPAGEKLKLPRGFTAAAILAFAGAGTTLLNLAESFFGWWTYSMTPPSNWVGIVCSTIVLLAVYIIIGVMILKRRSFALCITLTSIMLSLLAIGYSLIMVMALAAGGGGEFQSNISPLAELAVDIALFILLIANRKKFIKQEAEEISRKAKTSKGVIWAALLALTGAVLFIICIIIKNIFENDSSEFPIPIILIMMYIITGLLVLRSGRAGFVMGIITTAFSFLIGSANTSLVISETPYLENMNYVNIVLPTLVLINSIINVALFVLLITNKGKLKKRKGSLIQPVYDVENALLDDHRYHYRHGDMRRGYAKKQAK